MYVAPAVPDGVIAHPESLKLGGERRELTVLFSDLIGEGIMAFRGAPVGNSAQSEQAVLAAIEMQNRMNTMAVEIAAETGAQLRMRIGINRGPCIVGNMGGTGRFAYTATMSDEALAAGLGRHNDARGKIACFASGFRRKIALKPDRSTRQRRAAEDFPRHSGNP